MLGRIKSFIGRHRLASGIAAVAGVGLFVFVLVWFQPQKLFLDQRVDERIPEAAAKGSDPAPGDDRSPQQAETRSKLLASGAFQSLEHQTTGKALILELASGRRILRFDSLNTSNGPDLHVYLSEIPPSDDWHAYGVRFVSLGKLKGNIGSQNYELPDDLDLSRFKSAVVWCKRFAVGFGVAGLPELASSTG
jgi:hypothetical protein